MRCKRFTADRQPKKALGSKFSSHMYIMEPTSYTGKKIVRTILKALVMKRHTTTTLENKSVGKLLK